MTNLKRVTDSLLGQLAQLRAKLMNPGPVMKQVGALGVSASQRAFVEQRLGDWEWPPRYPGMEPPFINVAGALQDFNSGRTKPKPSRFQDRPALVDEGQRGGLWGSLSFRQISPKAVEWGTNKEYSSLHQEGGRSEQPVTAGAKERLGAYLKSLSKGDRRQVSKKLGFLFKTDVLVTNVSQRPFLGVTDQLEKDMIRAVTMYFEKKQQGGSGSKAATA